MKLHIYIVLLVLLYSFPAKAYNSPIIFNATCSTGAFNIADGSCLGASEAGVDWGDISGVLSDQTDLNTALNARLKYRGDWIDSSTQYFPNDVVNYLGITYIALEEQHGASPDSGAPFWSAPLYKLPDIISAYAGTTALPSFTFGPDNSTGLSLPSNATLALSTGGLAALTLGNDQSAQFAHDVHITGNISANNFPQTGDDNAFAGYDSSGAQTSVPGWNYFSDFNGLNEYHNIDFGSDASTYTNLNITQTDLNPSVNEPSRNGAQFLSQMRLDPANAGKQLGDWTNATFQMDHDSSGAVHSMTNLNLNTQAGDNSFSGGSTPNINILQSYIELHPGHTVGSINGINYNGNINGLFDGTGGYKAYSDGLNFSNIAGMQYYTGYGEYANMAGNMGSHGIESFHTSIQFQNTFNSQSITAYDDYNAMQTGSTVQDYHSADFSPFFDTGTTVSDQIQVINVSPHGAGSVANTTGLNIDMTQLTGLPTGVLPYAINAQGAVNLDSNFTAPAGVSGEFQFNDIGGDFTIANGVPVTNTFGFVNNLAGSVEFHDDMGDDGTGVKIGLTTVGFVGLVSGDSGKTVDTINFALGGGGVPSGSTGGVVTNTNVFKAIGYLPEGGTLSTTNMTAFDASSILCLLATNCWGVKIMDSSADNFFSKDVVIGGSTGKPTVGVALDVTGKAKLSDLLQLPVQAAAATPACAGTSDDGNLALTSAHILCVCNGTTPAWVTASNGITPCTF